MGWVFILPYWFLRLPPPLVWKSPLHTASRGPGSSVGIATGYGLDGPGSNPGVEEIFRTCPDRPWGPSSLLYNGYRVFPGAKVRPGCHADPSPLLVPWSRKSRAIPLLTPMGHTASTEPQCLYSTAIPLLPLLAVRPVQSLSACTVQL